MGIRYQPPGSSGIVTAAVYDLREENRLSPDPDNPFSVIQLGEAKIRGLELEDLVGLTRNLDLIASYGYTHARTSDGAGTPNAFIAEVSEHATSAWATYRFRLGGLAGFSIGAGVRYVGKATYETGTLDVPSVTLFDGSLSYDTAHWRLALNTTNLTDKTYISTCLARGDCFYGSRATVVGSVSFTLDLMTPMAKRRRRVTLSGPWPVRMRPRSSS